MCITDNVAVKTDASEILRDLDEFLVSEHLWRVSLEEALVNP